MEESFEIGPEKNRRYSKKRGSCGKCCIACSVCVVITLIVIVGGGFAVTQYMKSSLGIPQNNITEADEEINVFLETWKAPEHIRKAMPHAFLGFDKTDQPVWLLNYGKYDLETILADESNLPALDLYRDQSIYRMYKSMRMRRKSGNLTWICIANMEGYSYSQAFDLTTLSYLQRLAGEYEDFMDKMDYAIIINMDFFARYFVKAVSVFLGPVAERFYTFGYDEEEWLPFILERIDMDQLPQEFGGYSNFTAIAEYFD